MSRKKVVLVIVEGPSDQMALEGLLDALFRREKVKTCVMHGDITSDDSVHAGNILLRIDEEIKVFLRRNFLKKTDLLCIIHVVDMDGAYIPDTLIQEDVSLPKTKYHLEGISAKSKAGIVDRNQRKRNNLNKLIDTSSIGKKTPYAVYYISCNLDHVLYNRLNLTDEEKEKAAYDFAEKYKNDAAGFRSFMTAFLFEVGKDYKVSWDFIRDSAHSLERHTNLALSFPGEDD